MRKTCGKTTVELWEDGSPNWFHVTVDGIKLPGLILEEMRDLEYCLNATIRRAEEIEAERVRRGMSR